MKITNYELRITNYAIALLVLFAVVIAIPSFAFGSDKWGGVDESVVEKYAEEHGRAPRDPFINTDQGDLLLFVFLLAGAVGGFIAGYYWKDLMDKKPQDSTEPDHRQDRVS